VDVKEEAILGSDALEHWYYVSKGRAIRSLLGNFTTDEVLDIGAGAGVFSKQLIECGICKRAVCVDPSYPGDLDVAHAEGEISFRRSVESVDQDLVLMMDVLEHVDDDLSLLRQYSSQLRTGALVVITVPAFEFLWSSHDDFLQHRRRYTVRSLSKLVRDAGLTVDRARYFFGLLFPLFATIRLIEGLLARSRSFGPRSSLKRHHRWINESLIRLHDLERATVFRCNVFAGLSVICVARTTRSAADLA